MAGLIFAGPSLCRDPIKQLPGLNWLPPAAQGDLFCAARERPAAIGLIDGLFETGPAVWHKEILWALAHGVRVFGGSSMGALRAAELRAFGMTGVGVIFRAYHDGEIEDDDEVAVLHGPAELDYLPLTVAQVNVRATVERASAERVISPAAAERFISLSKSCFYKDRTWPVLFRMAETAGTMSGAEIAALRDWVPSGFVDQKRQDALLLVSEMQGSLRSRSPRPAPCFEFQNTTDWQAFLREHGSP